MNPRSLAIAVSGSVLAALLTGGCGNGTPEDGAVRTRTERVRVASAVTRDFESGFEATGTLVAHRRAELRALAEGQIEKLPVDIGSRVAAGDLLFEVRTIDYKLALQQAEAALHQARVAVTDREREKTRVENLLAEGSATGQMRDQATTALEAAKASLELATAARDRARQSLDDCTVGAPFAGAITQRQREVGEYVRRADAVLEISDLARLDAEIQVPERYVGGVVRGSDVSLTVPSSKITVVGKVSAVNPKVDDRTHTFEVKVAVDNRAGRMQAGLLVTAAFVLPREVDQVAIPDAALQCDEGSCSVWVVADGKARRRPVQEGTRADGRVLVRSGLEAGEVVVVEGTGGLSDGVSVETVTGDSSPGRTDAQ